MKNFFFCCLLKIVNCIKNKSPKKKNIYKKYIFKKLFYFNWVTNPNHNLHSSFIIDCMTLLSHIPSLKMWHCFHLSESKINVLMAWQGKVRLQPRFCSFSVSLRKYVFCYFMTELVCIMKGIVLFNFISSASSS